MKKYSNRAIIILILIQFIFISCSKKENEIASTFKLSTSIQPAEGGAVSPASGTYEEGEQIGITATASTNWSFKNWSGSLTGSTNPALITMSSDKEIIAVFEPSDLDGDGVENKVDNCPDTPAGESVDVNGCSALQIDADGDGVLNDADICSNTPSGETADLNGCSDTQKDTDNDGVNDANDLCANTPIGAIVGPIGCSDIQVRLNQGETPLEIVNSGVMMAELYGKTYKGGLLFYLNPTDGTGLVAAPEDLTDQFPFRLAAILNTGATDSSIGAGRTNTTLIINAFGPGDYAATACNSYTSGGFDDWFLPSLNELQAIYDNLIASDLGGFGPNWYWSSTQWELNFGAAGFLNNELGATFPGLDGSAAVFVRPVRAF